MLLVPVQIGREAKAQKGRPTANKITAAGTRIAALLGLDDIRAILARDRPLTW